MCLCLLLRQQQLSHVTPQFVLPSFRDCWKLLHSPSAKRFFKDADIGSGDSEVTRVRSPSPVKTHEHLSRVGITFSLCNPGAVWVQCWWEC